MTTRYSAYQKRWLLDRSRGIDRSPIDAGRVRDHIAALMASGVKLSTLARLSDCSKSTIRAIAGARTDRCQRNVAARILAVNLSSVLTGQLPPRCHVPAVGALRRVRALQAIGHTFADIGAIAGADVSQVVASTSIARATHEGIVRAYNQLSMIPGHSQHNRTWAANRGWPSPLAWDDDTIDDPAAQPLGTHTRTTTLRTTIYLEDVELLAVNGATWSVTAARTGSSRNSIEQHLIRHNRRDLMARLAANSEGEYALAERRGGKSA